MTFINDYHLICGFNDFRENYSYMVSGNIPNLYSPYVLCIYKIGTLVIIIALFTNKYLLRRC